MSPSRKRPPAHVRYPSTDAMQPSEYFILVLFIVLGGFSIIAALLNMEWFFQTTGALTFVRQLGRTGARWFYALLGFALIACGIAGFIYL